MELYFALLYRSSEGANGAANEDIINFIGPHVAYSHNPAYFDVETNEPGASGDDADIGSDGHQLYDDINH